MDNVASSGVDAAGLPVTTNTTASPTDFFAAAFSPALDAVWNDADIDATLNQATYPKHAD